MESSRNYINKINKMLQSGQLLGPDHTCKDYPCHFREQDCTWCFCPFYPCKDRLTGGKRTKSEWTGEMVWGCGDCAWIHKPDVAKRVLDELLKISNAIDKIPQKELVRIRLKILEGSPRH